MIKKQAPITIWAILALLFCSASYGQESSPVVEKADQTKTGTINGRVVNESGQPMGNATVFVRAFGTAGQVRRTSTDAEGFFQVSDVEPSAYIVSASLPAYTTAPRDPDSTQPTYYRVGDSVKLELIKGGVITGSVTKSTGEPVVAVPVRAYMIRDGNNRPPRYSSPFRERTSDDRGVYRIYGLAPGTYVVSAGGGSNFSGYGINAYDSDIPTFAPSSTRDTATEVTVRAGEEVSNVDIRYRGEPGHTVSGIAIGPGIAPPSGFTVLLSSVFAGESQSSNTFFQRPGSRGFSFYGVADGDYDLTAQSFVQADGWAVSENRRIKVRGADIGGIELITKPLGSIGGRIVLQESTSPECKGKRRPLFAETVVTPWHNEKNLTRDQPQLQWALGGPALPDKQGDFTLRSLAPGQYRFNVRTFAKYWYLQSISLSPSAAAAARPGQASKAVDAARYWTTLKTGDRLSGLTITLAAGAASLHGQIKLSEGQKLVPRIFVYLVPAERERAEDILRYFAYQVSSDGTFALNNLPPGHYWLLAKVAVENESSVLSKLRLPDEAENRAKLRKQAEAAKTEAVLKPCQNVTGYQVQFDPALKMTSATHKFQPHHRLMRSTLLTRGRNL
jgi:hypothetical protein